MAESESSRIADLRKTIELLSACITDIDIEIDTSRKAKKSESGLIDLIKSKSEAQKLREEKERELQIELAKSRHSSGSSVSPSVIAHTIDGNGVVNIRPPEDHLLKPAEGTLTYEKILELKRR